MEDRELRHFWSRCSPHPFHLFLPQPGSSAETLPCAESLSLTKEAWPACPSLAVQPLETLEKTSKSLVRGCRATEDRQSQCQGESAYVELDLEPEAPNPS